MLNKLRILNLIRNIESITGTRRMKSVLPTVVIQEKPRFKKRVFDKVLSMFPMAKNIRCLTLSPKSLVVEIFQVINILVQSVIRSIGVSA